IRKDTRDPTKRRVSGSISTVSSAGLATTETSFPEGLNVGGGVGTAAAPARSRGDGFGVPEADGGAGAAGEPPSGFGNSGGTADGCWGDDGGGAKAVGSSMMRTERDVSSP